ncbi:hypothetical protein C8Q73DRAFT_164981 [Cubamyces lactineus]|nr:hypothetical protein C8Q73DRAFT_164981 [Cubamyces lactineus]
MTLSFPLVCLHPSLCLPPPPRSATPECVCARRGPRPRAYVLSDCPASTYKETSTLRTSCARSVVRDPVFFFPSVVVVIVVFLLLLWPRLGRGCVCVLSFVVQGCASGLLAASVVVW